MNDVVTMLLAGGRGSRLNVLADRRAKPAVPFAGNYRIIDFALTNIMKSGLSKVGVLTQYRPLALTDHLSDGAAWDLVGRKRLIRVLPPFTGGRENEWYRGTADAVRQNLDFVRRFSPKQVLILSGDHIYDMDYAPMIREHRRHGAEVTLAVMEVPWEEAPRFGTVITTPAPCPAPRPGDDDSAGELVAEFDEKPPEPRSNLASMGIYVFETEALLRELSQNKGAEAPDFGKHVIPEMLASSPGKIFAYRYTGYWRDVGTIRSYWDACMDALDPSSGLDLAAWETRTNSELRQLVELPPARIERSGAVYNALVSRGSVIQGTVINSVLSTNVVVEKGAVVRDSVLLHRVRVEAGAQIDRVVVDNDAVIGREAQVGYGESDKANKQFPEHINDGITLIGKGASIPPQARVGRNCLVKPGVTTWGFLKKNDLKHGETAERKR